MSASEIRAQARKDLSGKWGKFILLNVLFIIVTAVLALLNMIPVVGAVVTVVVTIPLEYGFLMNQIRLKRGETESVTEFFKLGFDNFGRSWAIVGHNILKLIVPLIVFLLVYIGGLVAILTPMIVASATGADTGAFVVLLFIWAIATIACSIWLIAKSLLIMLSQYFAIDNENMTAKEAVEQSVKVMQGNRVKYICLSLSFIGWAILSSLTCGIGYLFLAPYIAVAGIVFYENLAGKKTENPVVESSADAVQEAKAVENVEETTTENDNPIKEE